MPSILGANTLSSGYDVDNSCRFNSGDSAVLKRTHGTPTNAKKFVWSAWIKRSKLGADQYFVQNFTDSSNLSMIYFRSGDDIRIFDRHGTGDGTDTVWISNGLFRDISAWYHILLKVDTTQSTDSNRLKVYINGVQDTGNGITYPAQNADMNFTSASASNRHSIAATSDGYNYFGGYLCEVVLIDGTSPAHTDFGEFDSDSPRIWKPKDVSGLTFGDNGYYLDFADSGDLGDDESGNGNDFAETNLAATDQTTDTCTNNFCTWNSLDVFYSGNTYQEGNTQGTKPNNSVESFGTSTFGISSGKWYAEFKVISFSGSNSTIGFGIIDRPSTRNDMEIGKYTYGITYKNNGYIYANDGATHSTDTGTTYGAGDIIGLYIDLDNLEFYAAKNGTILNSGTGFEIQPLSSTANGVYFFGFDNFANGGSVHQANWGNPAYTGTDQADANGYGSFEYSPSSGTFDGASKDFYSLNTKNLAEFG